MRGGWAERVRKEIGGRRRGKGGREEKRVGKMKKTKRTRWNAKKEE